MAAFVLVHNRTTIARTVIAVADPFPPQSVMKTTAIVIQQAAVVTKCV